MGPIRAGQRLASLIEAGMSLASELDLEALLQKIADVARDVMPARYAAVGVLAPDGVLSRFVYSGIDQDTALSIGDLPVGRGVLGTLIEEGRPLRLREISEHPHSVGYPPNHPPMHSFLGVPIATSRGVFGRLYVTEKIGDKEFSKDDERIAQMLASQAAIAVENARLTEALKDLAVLEERERISKELHDGVIQSIYSVGLSLQGTLAVLRGDPDRATERIDGVIAELDNVVRDVRGYIFELQPKTVQEKGLAAAIDELVRDLEVNTLAHTTVELDKSACDALAEDVKSHTIQIVRELLSNIARHSGLSELRLVCRSNQGTIELVVEDDGTTYDPATVKRGHGLRNIEQRVEAMGAKIDISERPGAGMIHALILPVGTDGSNHG